MGEIIKDPISAALTEEHAGFMSQLKETARAQYGENRKITDGNYDESLAAPSLEKSREILSYTGVSRLQADSP